jgi:hypothetical protein
MKPQARTDLLLRDLDGEAVVYDFSRNEAHCLNATALAVFRRADGTIDIAELARRVSADLGTAVDEELVWMALAELDKAHLLSTPLPRKRGVDLGRRRVLKKMALTAALSVAIPAVWSIVAPTPAYAATAVMCTPANNCPMGNPMDLCCGSMGVPAGACSNGLCAAAPPGSFCAGKTCQ